MKKKECEIQLNFDFFYTAIYKGGKKIVEDDNFLVKLNSNENPFGPKPEAFEAIHESLVLDLEGR